MRWTNRILHASAAATLQAASRFRHTEIRLAVLATGILVSGFSITAYTQQSTPAVSTSAVSTSKSSPQAGSQQIAPPPLPPATPQHTPELRFMVILDPAHGGTDNGALLATASPEKNYTLALAIRLHALLSARGIRSVLTRDTDSTLDATSRAVLANRSHAAACILLHATSTGNGVHLFTSSLPNAGQQITHNPRRAFLPWQTAQASYGTESLRLESDIHAALADQHIPILMDRTPLAPLDNLACPAVAVEVAPLDANTPLSDPLYQQKMAQSLAAALTQWRSDWRLQP